MALASARTFATAGLDLVRPRFRRRSRSWRWPLARLTLLDRHDLRAMAKLTSRPIAVFVHQAVLAFMAAEHRRLFPNVPSPWRQAPVPGDAALRVAEGDAGG